MNTQANTKPFLSELAIIAPIDGVVVPIEQVPDAVFAEKMVGDGLGIEPTGSILRAPFDAIVVQVQSTNHAITLRHECGVEILMHIGIDTVLLKGEGFSAKVAVGDQVHLGDPLIEIDIDAIAQKAKSLITAIIVINGEKSVAEIVKAADGIELDGSGTLMKLMLKHEKSTTKSVTGYWVKSKPVIIPNSAGIHARPAAALIKLVKTYQADIELACNGVRSSANSLTNILKLNIQFGDEVVVYARGGNAKAAVYDLAMALKAGLGDHVEEVLAQVSETSENQPKEESLLFPPSKNDRALVGVMASPGIARGVIYSLQEEVLNVTETAQNTTEEIVAFDQAIFQSQRELQNLQAQFQKKGDAEHAKIFSAHQELLGDPEIYDQSISLIRSGKSAGFSWQFVIDEQIALFSKIDNPILRERTSDLKDVGRRVLRHILGLPSHATRLPKNTIIIADDLTPSDTANLDTEKVVGFCTLRGGATSHSAILARSMNIPAIAGIDKGVLALANNTEVLINADEGTLYIEPEPELIERQLAQRKRDQEIQAINRANTDLPATTLDNVRIEVVANIGSISDAVSAGKQGGDGVGLLRSEFIFMNRTSAPSEEEQYQIYRSTVESLAKDQPLVVRTLDVGGDKPLPYLPLPKEDNPFLGERGIRIGLDRPELLRCQLRALLRASKHGNIMIMFPMISDRYELMLAKQLLNEEREKLGVDAVPVGIMIEVPSAAMMADVLAPEVDFFSIGTNDLTQYTLAMDRGHPKLASLADAMHPSVLRMIKLTTDAAKAHGKWVGVCGGLASDPLAVPVLLGLGVTELSVGVPSIPDIKAMVRTLKLGKCEELAIHALQFSSAREVREYLETTQQYLK